MSIFYPLLFPWISAFFLLRALLKSTALPQKTFLLTLLAGPVGLGLASLIFFWSYASGFAHPQRLAHVIITLLGSILLLIYLKEKSMPGLIAKVRNGTSHIRTLATKALFGLPFFPPDVQNRWSRLQSCWNIICVAVFLYCVISFLNRFITLSTYNIFGGWDAQFFYKLKASFFVRAPLYWKDMFDRTLGPSDYPLLLPAATAWGWSWAGQEMLAWPVIIDFIFIASLCGLIFWYLSSFVSFQGACLASAFFLSTHAYCFWARAQYADIPLCFFITSATLLLLRLQKNKAGALFILSGLLTGLAMWTKNEGVLFAMPFTVLICMPFAQQGKNLRIHLKHLGGFFLALAPLAGTIVYLKIALGGSGDYLHEDAGSYFFLRWDWLRIRFILSCIFYFKAHPLQWNGLWLIFGAALLFNPLRALKENRWMILIIMLFLELAYGAILYVTPDDLLMDLDSGIIPQSLFRLLLHTAALALIFTFELTSPLRTVVPGMGLTPKGEFDNTTDRLSRLLSSVFVSLIIFQIVWQIYTEQKKKWIIEPKLIQSLMSGRDMGYIVRGNEMSAFKPFLPPAGTVGFLTDFPFGMEVSDEQLRKKRVLFHDAQLFLAPLVLDHEPGQTLAILYASNEQTAEERLQEMGYRWFKKIAPGKGVIIKK